MATENFVRIKRLLEDQQHALQEIYRDLSNRGRRLPRLKPEESLFPRSYSVTGRHLSSGAGRPVGVSPGAGGAQGGAFVSPAKAATARTHIKVTETPSLFRFFMFSP